ncbi:MULTISPECIES: 3-isopropylmalate dehydratase small subunit [unclassified Prochlorococcus]|uniref:3-isopropylmalate dehydratase small subunit n=1 Tax=unclassified Prochlorococcus TaxID=2627481 RepID=UPI0005337EA2|nr:MULTISPECIES: 3-isopropylmalate dehydratase small subunit [unclassified Prochlorococcus]KGG16674.1 3-isopropylmalate dehydratase small subunit [Prochlorococcus sp. MIT 0602]KGG18354.1 3-isopropylmalate dehydratase small subunit [Prochlorococcus sp. MIT 0603]
MQHISPFPSGPVQTIEGECLYLKGNDIDTDRIIPARFLKCINFDSLGSNVFADDRKEKNGLHPFDQDKMKSILIVDRNFGCGSSREHAPQALMRWGIRAIIGQSFAEIFFGNCLSIGIPCACISESQQKTLIASIQNREKAKFQLDIKKKLLTSKEINIPLKIDIGAMEMLISGRWDATSTLLEEKEKINIVRSNLPYLKNFQFGSY